MLAASSAASVTMVRISWAPDVLIVTSFAYLPGLCTVAVGR